MSVATATAMVKPRRAFCLLRKDGRLWHWPEPPSKVVLNPEDVAVYTSDRYPADHEIVREFAAFFEPTREGA